MNALLLVAALAGGQCEAGVYAVTVEAAVVEVGPMLAHRHDIQGRRIAPLRRAVHVIRDHKPVRTFFRNRKPLRRFIRSRPLLRLGRRVFGRRCG